MNQDSAATSADPSVNPGYSADPRRILAERVEQLYGQTPIAIAGLLGLAVIATYGLWGAQFLELALFWWGVVLLIAAASATLYAGYRRSTDRAANAGQWMRWLAISALASGTVWGFTGAAFFPSGVDQQHVFLALLLAGVGCGGIWAYAASWPIFALYAGAIAVPFTYVLAAAGDRLSTELAFLVAVVFGMSVGIVYRLNQVFYSGHGLKHAYRNLSDQYGSLNMQLEGQMEELTHAQRMIGESGRKLALFAERAPIPVFEVDHMGTILDMNTAAETVFGYSSSELVGRNLLRSIIPPEASVHGGGWWTNFVAVKQPEAGVRAHCLRRDGLEVVCEFSVTPLVNENGDLISAIVQARDITQQLDAERVKKEFTSTLSHELRTPLTSIIGSLQLVTSGALGEVQKDIGELTEVAERNAQRLLDLINDLLDIEKIESGQFSMLPEEVELDNLVRESIVLNRAFADRFGVRLMLRNEPPRIKVYADRRRLLQVLTNLISNAAKFSPEGDQIELGVSVADSRAIVSVDDRGPGIPIEFRSRIFNRFAQADSALTRKKAGTGLGLAISKLMVELMDGHIGFADREGGGTRFFIELPLREYAGAGKR